MIRNIAGQCHPDRLIIPACIFPLRAAFGQTVASRGAVAANAHFMRRGDELRGTDSPLPHAIDYAYC